MADFAPMLTAIRECLQGTIGSVRTVTAGSIVERAYPSTPEHEAARVLVGPRFEASVTETSPHPASPWEHSPTRILAIRVEVRSEWTTAHEIIDASRAATRAAALNQLESCRAALMRAGNLATTSASVATGLVSGCLHRLEGHRVEREDWPGRRLSWISTYTTAITITQTAG